MPVVAISDTTPSSIIIAGLLLATNEALLLHELTTADACPKATLSRSKVSVWTRGWVVASVDSFAMRLPAGLEAGMSEGLRQVLNNE